jgi:tripartite-type tricarboxylate transporter receptor subunit TctC
VPAKIAASLCVVSALAAATASAQTYPTRPIRILTSAAGGGNDVVSRLIGQGIAGPLGQPVVIDNRAGIVSIDTVAKATPNGYTLLVIGSSLWIEPLMKEQALWNPLRDFAPISLAVSTPNVLVVHPSVRATTTKELIALAKARPGELNYASAGSGSTPHVSAELFKHMAGLNIVRVVYKGTAAALNDLMSGEVQLAFSPAGTVSSHVKSGKLRALSVTSAQPSELFPGLPTVAASGVPGYESASTYGVFAPARTPPAIVARLNLEIVRTLGQPDVKEKLFNTGSEAVGSTPQELEAKIKSDMARFGKVLKPVPG